MVGKIWGFLKLFWEYGVILLAASSIIRNVECSDFAFSCFAGLRTIPVPFCHLELSPGAVQDTHILHPPELTQALLVMPGIPLQCEINTAFRSLAL